MIFRFIALVLFIVAAITLGAGVAKADSVAWVEPDDNRIIMQEIIDAVTYVEYKYSTGPITVGTAWLEPNVFAAANGAGIIINKQYSTGTLERLNGELADDIATGYHNAGCSPARTIALHEAAHVIDHRRGLSPRYQLDYEAANLDLRGYLAGYSFTPYGELDEAEALAEAFQAVECGTANAVEHELYSMLVG